MAENVLIAAPRRKLHQRMILAETFSA